MSQKWRSFITVNRLEVFLRGTVAHRGVETLSCGRRNNQVIKQCQVEVCYTAPLLIEQGRQRLYHLYHLLWSDVEKSHPKTKTESSKCQPAWERRVHLLCWLGLADQSCVEEGMMCNWKQRCKSLEKPTCKSNTATGLLMRICVLYSPQKKAGISWSRPSRHCAEAYQNECYVGVHMVYLPMRSTGALRDWSQGLFKHVLCLKKGKQSEILWSDLIRATQRIRSRRIEQMKPSVHSVRDGRVCLNIKYKEHLSQINVYLKY